MTALDASATWGQPESSLPYLTKKETLKRYRMRIEGAQAWRDDEKYDDVWKRLRDVYRLKVFKSESDEDRIAVAVAFATINVIEPSISISYPKITVLATAEPDADKATIAEAAINYWWQHYLIQNQFRRASKDFLIYGHGWLKVGYRYTEGDRALTPDELAQQHADMAGQADQFAVDHPHLAADLPSDGDIAAQMPTTTPIVLEDRPFVERVSPFDMFIDPEATCMEDARWIVQRVIRPIEEVRADQRYRSSVRNRLESDGSVVWQNSDSKHHVDAESGRITLWEFYDLVRKTMCVFADTGDNFLVDPEPMPYTYGLPYVMLRDYDVPDQFYPIGELEALEPLQNELNETRSSMVRARKKDSVRKYLYHEDSLGTGAAAALRSDQDNTMVPIAGTVALKESVIPLEAAPTNTELYRHSDVVLSDFDRVSGVTEYQRGETPAVRHTATEANIIQDAANSRAADKLATIEHAVAEVARRLLQLAQTYMTDDQLARRSGADGTHVFFKYTREDIEGEFDFSCEAGSTQPINEASKRQDAIQLLQVVAPMMDSGVIEPRALATHVLQAFGIKNTSKFIIPPPPPEQGPPHPPEKILEMLNYKDLPPDVQRQVEAGAGLKPSALGNMPNPAVKPAAASAAPSGG